MFPTFDIKRPIIGFAFTIAVGIVALVVFFLWSSDSGKLRVTFLDVGQGDAIFIEAPNGQRILIDGGPDATILRKLGRRLPLWDRRIDLLVNTHPQSDHIAGLLPVLDRYRVDHVLTTGVSHTTEEYLAWLKTLQEKNIQTDLMEGPPEASLARGGPRTIVIEGRRGEHAELQLLYPLASVRDAVVPELNNTSIIARLVYGETSFLFTGDAEMRVEEELLARGIDVHADVLKIGHHGSATSTSEEFIDAVEPTYAVISAGRKNKFGHPSLRTVRRLERAEVKIFRTDQHGDVQLTSDGKTLEITTERNRE